MWTTGSTRRWSISTSRAGAGNIGLSGHYDATHLFERPIWSLRLLHDAELRFVLGGAGQTCYSKEVPPLASIPLKRGAVTVMYGFAARGPMHQVHVDRTPTASLVIRTVHEALLSKKRPREAERDIKCDYCDHKGSWAEIFEHEIQCKHATNTHKRAATPFEEGGLKVLDLCCGAGGFSWGFQEQGCSIVAGVENNRGALATFAKNFPHARTHSTDLCNAKERKLLVDKYEGGIDVVVGGPPCPGFSCAHQTKENQKLRKLLGICVTMGIEVGARAIVMENAQLTRDTPEAKAAIRELEMNGYSVMHQVVDAADYGVPQHRKRFILVATKGELGFAWPPAVAQHTTVRQALAEHPIPQEGELVSDATLRKALHVFTTGKRCFMGCNKVVKMDQPASTVLRDRRFHLMPQRDGLRYPSTQELLRLQSAPLDFADKLCLIGNMVPPKLAFAIARGISLKKKKRMPQTKPLIESKVGGIRVWESWMDESGKTVMKPLIESATSSEHMIQTTTASPHLPDQQAFYATER
jgi:site-specific DNA-cytosine methylase